MLSTTTIFLGFSRRHFNTRVVSKMLVYQRAAHLNNSFSSAHQKHWSSTLVFWYLYRVASKREVKCLRECIDQFIQESIFLFRDDERVQRKCESGTTHARRDMEDSWPIQRHEDKLQTTAVEYSSLRTFARKFPNIDFDLNILTLKDDEFVLSKMKKKIEGSPTLFRREHARKNT